MRSKRNVEVSSNNTHARAHTHTHAHTHSHIQQGQAWFQLKIPGMMKRYTVQMGFHDTGRVGGACGGLGQSARREACC